MALQLDKTRLAIHERGYLEILDAALHVLRHHASALLLCLAVGVAPFFIFNYWLLSGEAKFMEAGSWHRWYATLSLFLVLFEAPLATLLATAYLGQAVFLEMPDTKRLLSELKGAFFQLVFFQGFVRFFFLGWPLFCIWMPGEYWALPIIVSLVVGWMPYTMWPFITEIILLERNPFRSRGRGGGMSTNQRRKALHRNSGGDLFFRLIGSLMFASMMVLAFGVAIYAVMNWTTGRVALGDTEFALLVQVCLWSAACFFCVVRFLSYLDLRIRREGWEVELKMRAEAVRLAEQLN